MCRNSLNTCMENIFLKYPEFIDQDVRINRYKNNEFDLGYNINFELQFIRHNLSLPGYLVKDKTILDLGCCVGATGAWALHHGAKHYTGVDLQSKFCKLAKNNLSKYFNQESWDIQEKSFDEFFSSSNQKFDIVIAWGVLYHSIDYTRTLEIFSKFSNDRIIIESYSPKIFQSLINHTQIDVNILKNIPYVEYPVTKLKTFMVHEEGKSLRTDAVLLSTNAVEYLLNLYGFNIESNLTDDIQKLLPIDYKDRFVLTFRRNSKQQESLSFETAYKNKSKQEFVEFTKNNQWEFNSTVAENFFNHATKHIPDYQRVIKKSIDVCRQLIKDPAEDRIIDVGCATGETIKQLYSANFHNLVGVDSSQEMLAKVADLPIAFWIHSSQFPEGNFHGVLCNWTLHFIREKLDYIKSMYNSIVSGGFLILTDKTKNSGVDLELYHEFKREQGVSEEEIIAKANSLKDVMFIDSPEWYLDTLRQVGFKEVSIINSAPCFTTFLALKN